MNSKRRKITVIGSYAVGMTMYVDRIPSLGETIQGHGFQVLHGGKGSNQAIAAARLSRAESGSRCGCRSGCGTKIAGIEGESAPKTDVVFLSCVGNDEFGDKGVAMLKSTGIETGRIKRSESLSTGVGFVTVDSEGRNIISIDLGANLDIDFAYLDSCRDILQNSGYVVFQMEIPIESVAYGIRLAKEVGSRVILNPAPYSHLDSEVYPFVDILTPNEVEAKLICGCRPDEDIDVYDLAARIYEKGVENVVITLGEKGALIYNSEIRELIPAFDDVEAVDTTGAGDVFTGALTVALSEGKDLRDSVRFACAAAAISVSRKGVVESIPLRQEVDDFLRERRHGLTDDIKREDKSCIKTQGE